MTNVAANRSDDTYDLHPIQHQDAPYVVDLNLPGHTYPRQLPTNTTTDLSILIPSSNSFTASPCWRHCFAPSSSFQMWVTKHLLLHRCLDIIPGQRRAIQFRPLDLLSRIIFPSRPVGRIHRVERQIAETHLSRF